jgi:hypothetical protein
MYGCEILAVQMHPAVVYTTWQAALIAMPTLHLWGAIPSSVTDCAAQQPRHRFVGARCVELGAGLGLCGVFLAKLGAQVQGCTAGDTRLRPSGDIRFRFDVRPASLPLQVVLTDLAQVVPVMQRSIDLNGLSKHR